MHHLPGPCSHLSWQLLTLHDRASAPYLGLPGTSSLTVASFSRFCSLSPPLHIQTLQMCPSVTTPQISRPLNTSSSHLLPASSYSSLNTQHKHHLCSKTHPRLNPTPARSHRGWHPAGTQWLFLPDWPFPTAFFCQIQGDASIS